jgi:CBS domain-containing protein
VRIGELCSRDLVSVTADTPLMEVAKLMRDEHVGIVIVTKAPADEPVAAGVITDRDIARSLLDRPAGLAGIQAEKVMTRDPLVLDEAESVETAIQHLRDRGVRRAPVVTSHGQLVGLVSTDDLIAHIAGELSSLGRLLEQQPRRERRQDRGW